MGSDEHDRRSGLLVRSPAPKTGKDSTGVNVWRVIGWKGRDLKMRLVV
jgi:hypothetical protein